MKGEFNGLPRHNPKFDCNGFEFNEFHVCMNPEIILNEQASHLAWDRVQLEIAQTKQGWCYGMDCGVGIPCSPTPKKLCQSKQEAIDKVIAEARQYVKDRLGRKSKEDSEYKRYQKYLQIIDDHIEQTKQLTLF